LKRFAAYLTLMCLSSQAQSQSALDEMAVVFVGPVTRNAIQSRLDTMLQLYGLPVTEAEYQRAGSILVALRKNSNGVREIDPRAGHC
jgi:hypothetical protein